MEAERSHHDRLAFADLPQTLLIRGGVEPLLDEASEGVRRFAE